MKKRIEIRIIQQRTNSGKSSLEILEKYANGINIPVASFIKHIVCNEELYKVWLSYYKKEMKND